MALLPPLLLAPPGAARDAAAAACWLAVNALLGTTAWHWARRLFPADGPLDLLQHTIVLSWGAVVAVALVLGGLGCLSGPALLLGVAALSLGAWAVGRRRRAGPFLGTVPLARAEAAWLTAWAVLFAFWSAHVLTRGLGSFPDDWDSLAYHIPLIDGWLQTGSLCAAGCSRWTNPGNNELLGLWAVGAFSGDFLVSLMNLPAAVLFACSGVAVARGLGLPRPLAHLAGLALVCNFVVLNQLVDAENDVAVAACFFAAVAYALRYQAAPGRASLLLGAASLGLLAGVKYYAAGYAALALAVWVLLAALAHGPRPALRVLLWGSAGLVALGGFWYVRNALLTGSPLYPREFFKHPDTLARIYPAVGQSSFFGNRRPELLGLYAEAIANRMGPCQLAGFVLAPLSLAWLVGAAAWYAGRDRAAARAHLALALLLLGTGLLLGATPFAVEDRAGTLNQMYWYYCPVRYGLCFLSTATLAALLPLRRLLFTRRGAASLPPLSPEGRGGQTAVWIRRWPAAVHVLACAALAVTVLFQVVWACRPLRLAVVDDLLLVAVFLLAGLDLAFLRGLWPRLRPGWWLLAAAVPAWAWACVLLADSWHQGFTQHYDCMQAFAGLRQIEQAAPGRQTVLVLEERLYPFFGSRRQLRAWQPVYVPSLGWILASLKDGDVRFVVAQREAPFLGMRRFLGFDECLARHPERFRQVLAFDGHLVVELLPPPRSEVRAAWQPR